jgi:hypothetical protein
MIFNKKNCAYLNFFSEFFPRSLVESHISIQMHVLFNKFNLQINSDFGSKISHFYNGILCLTFIKCVTSP